MTTLIHVGDIHLQSGHERNADRLASFDQIIDEGLRLEGLAAWLIPGDLFHTRSSVQDRNDLAERLIRMCGRAPVVLVRGNHDQQMDLNIFAKLKGKWPVYLSTRPELLRVPLPTGETAAIATLPYPDKFGFVSAGVAPGDVVSASSAPLEAIFMTLAHELEASMADGAIPLFAGHVNVRGAIASTGQPQIGNEIELDQSMLARLPAVYCALNHIHKPQQCGAGVYAGSVAACDHGETEPKSYVVLEVDMEHRAATWTRHPLHTPPMFHVEGRLTRAGFQPDHDEWMCPACHGSSDGERGPDGDTLPCAACQGTGVRSWEGCDVRARYRYLVSEKAALDETHVRSFFAGALRLKVEPIAEQDRALRSQAVAEAKTLADKLRAYAAVAGIDVTDGVLSKLARLEHTAAPDLLAEVTRALGALETLPVEDVEVEAVLHAV